MNNFYTFVYPSLNFFFKFLIFFLPRFKAGKLSNQKKKKKKKKQKKKKKLRVKKKKQK